MMRFKKPQQSKHFFSTFQIISGNSWGCTHPGNGDHSARYEEGGERMSKKEFRGCMCMCVCVCELCGGDGDQTSWGNSKKVVGGMCQSLRRQCVVKTETRGLVSEAGNTAVQLFVSVLRLVLRLGGVRANHQTFAEVPSSLKELWGIHK